jgi:hypothetical protein
VEQTIDGGYIIAGHRRYFRFGPEPHEVFLIKTNPFGDTLWTQMYKEPLDDYAYSVEQTADGHYLIAGSTDSYSAGGNDAWLIKTDALGNRIWSQPYGGRYEDFGSFVRITNDGNYLLGGTTDSFSPNRMMPATETEPVVIWAEELRWTAGRIRLAGQPMPMVDGLPAVPNHLGQGNRCNQR